MLINTHIDADHINGLISFLKDNNRHKYVDIGGIWYNGFEQLSTKYPGIYGKEDGNSEDKKIIDDICNKGYEDEFNEVEQIGSSEGISFASLIDEGGYVHNQYAITEQLHTIELSKNIRIRVIGPAFSVLEELEEEWLEEMAKKNFTFSVSKDIRLTNSFEFMISRIKRYYECFKKKITSDDALINYTSDLTNEDSSIVNESSISFVLEVNERKFLFLGDAVLKQRDKCKIIKNLLAYYGEDTVFDLIKLPHHGSNYNMSIDFVKLFKAKEYIISSNGKKFGHPDIDTLANIILFNKDVFKTLIFNYPVWQSKFLSNNEWMKKYSYEVEIGNGNSIIERSYT